MKDSTIKSMEKEDGERARPVNPALVKSSLRGAWGLDVVLLLQLPSSMDWLYFILHFA